MNGEALMMTVMICATAISLLTPDASAFALVAIVCVIFAFIHKKDKQ